MRIKILLSLFAVTALVFSVGSCKKENPEEPVNGGGETVTCTFCPQSMLQLNEENLIESTDFAEQVSFLEFGGADTTGPNQIASKTATGFYGFQGGVAIRFNLSELPLSCPINKITFVHAYSPGASPPRVVNVQFPGTPLISHYPDSIADFLAPYGYTVESYIGSPGFVWMDTISAFFPGLVDSVIIRGPSFETVTIGANLFESELRSFCISHE